MPERPIDPNLIKNLVRVTLRCNARCVFCNIPPESEPGFAEPTEESLVAQVRDIARRSRGRGIVLSGGEPTLCKAALRAASEARKAGAPWVEIQTNGLLVDGELAGAMAGAGIGKALVALLSSDATVHDGLTGVEGSWSKTVRSIHLLHKAGIEVILNLLMTGPTTKSYPGLVRFVLREFPFVKEVNFSAVSATGRCASRPDLWPDYDEARPVIRQSLAEAKKKRVRCLNPFCGLPVCAGWHHDLELCVEAQEMKAARTWGRKPADIEGLRNEGEKVQPGACLDCCFRTACGGIWRAVDAGRGDRGLRPPLKIARRFSRTRARTPGAAAGRKRKDRALMVPLAEIATLAACRRVLTSRKKTCIMVSFHAGGGDLPGWLPEAVRCAVKEDYGVIQVVAGGERLSDRNRCRDLLSSGVTEILIPLWSASPPVHDAAAGIEGSFEKTLRAMACVLTLAKDRFPAVNVVPGTFMLRRTPGELGSFLTLCEKLQIREFFFLKPLPPAPPPPAPDIVSGRLEELGARIKSSGVRLFSIGLPPGYGLQPYDDAAVAVPLWLPKKNES